MSSSIYSFYLRKKFTCSCVDGAYKSEWHGYPSSTDGNTNFIPADSLTRAKSYQGSPGNRVACPPTRRRFLLASRRCSKGQQSCVEKVWSRWRWANINRARGISLAVEERGTEWKKAQTTGKNTPFLRSRRREGRRLGVAPFRFKSRSQGKAWSVSFLWE